MKTTRLAVVRDFRAEGWPSMDLCADALLRHLPGDVPHLTPVDFEVQFRRRAQRLPFLGRRSAAFNADRLFNRHVVLPRALRRKSGFDLFHVADHSYAHVVLDVPPGRAGVYCHDLDAFRSLINPRVEPRPWWYRRLARRTLAGLQAAAVVFHNSHEVGRQLIAAELVTPAKLVYAPLGVAEEFSPTRRAVSEPAVERIIGSQYLLHVGSNIPRKRVDVLIDVSARLHAKFPNVRLVQVGGPWPASIAAQIERLGINSTVTQLRNLSRASLAALYQNAAAVLITSEAEGFGLPVIEALACGSIVVASDIPVLREVGGEAVVFCPVANVEAWTEAVAGVLEVPDSAPSQTIRLRRAAEYSWRSHARIIGATYLSLAEAACGCYS